MAKSMNFSRALLNNLEDSEVLATFFKKFMFTCVSLSEEEEDGGEKESWSLIMDTALFVAIKKPLEIVFGWMEASKSFSALLKLNRRNQMSIILEKEVPLQEARHS
jgi:hypothetical protein